MEGCCTITLVPPVSSSVQVLNAGAGLMACGVASSVAEGVAMAQEAQRSGRALKVLDDWVALSQVTPQGASGKCTVACSLYILS